MNRRKSFLLSTVTFLLIGAFLMWIGDLFAASDRQAGLIVFLLGLAIFLLPFMYFLFGRRSSDHRSGGHIGGVTPEQERWMRTGIPQSHMVARRERNKNNRKPL